MTWLEDFKRAMGHIKYVYLLRHQSASGDWDLLGIYTDEELAQDGLIRASWRAATGKQFAINKVPANRLWELDG